MMNLILKEMLSVSTGGVKRCSVRLYETLRAWTKKTSGSEKERQEVFTGVRLVPRRSA